MRNLIKVSIVVLALIGIYALFAIKYVPAPAPEKPPAETVASAEPATVAELVGLGDKLFHGKGSCPLCHDPMGARAPKLEGVALTAVKRIKEEGYKGRATTQEGYLYESLVEPSAYVVPGYSVAGAGSTSPMPRVTDPAIGFNETEIAAVIAYMQKASGVPVTAAPPGRAEPKK